MGAVIQLARPIGEQLGVQPLVKETAGIQTASPVIGTVDDGSTWFGLGKDSGFQTHNHGAMTTDNLC